MREAGVAKTAVFRWQERFMQKGIEGLLHEKKRPPGIAHTRAEVLTDGISAEEEDANRGHRAIAPRLVRQSTEIDGKFAASIR